MRKQNQKLTPNIELRYEGIRYYDLKKINKKRIKIPTDTVENNVEVLDYTSTKNLHSFRAVVNGEIIALRFNCSAPLVARNERQ